jgi:hypothetical protein
MSESKDTMPDTTADPKPEESVPASNEPEEAAPEEGSEEEVRSV